MAHSSRTYSLWQSFLSNTCLGCTSTESYTLLEEEEEEEYPAVTEKTRYRDLSPPPSSRAPLPPTSSQPMTSISPPAFLPQPQSTPPIDIPTKRLHRRALLTTSNFHTDEVTSSDSRVTRASKYDATITETELTDNLNLVDTASVVGSVGSLVATGYGAASYYAQKRAEKEAKRREQDLEAAIRGVAAKGVAAKIETEETGRFERGSGGSSEAGLKEERVPEPGPLKSGDFTWTGMR